MKQPDLLALDNQLCFPIYATSRLITKLYQPMLDELGLTYTQYLVMLVLWEKDRQKITDIGKRLLLNTNTLTPLITKLIKKGVLTKERSAEDERTVFVSLTDKGKTMRERAECIPTSLVENMELSPKEWEEVQKVVQKFFGQVKLAVGEKKNS